MKIFENRARQLKRVAPSIAENQRLRESMETLEKMLAEAHMDRGKLQAEKTQLEVENWELMNQLGNGVDQEKSKALGPMVFCFHILNSPMLVVIFHWCRA